MYRVGLDVYFDFHAFLKITCRINFIVGHFFHELTCPAVIIICQGHRTIYLSTIFATIFRTRRWLLATTYVFTFFTIILDISRRQNGAVLTETFQRLYGNRTGIVQSSCNLQDIRSKIARCPCDVNAGSLRLVQEPTIIIGAQMII